jgi:hypothetical protein
VLGANDASCRFDGNDAVIFRDFICRAVTEKSHAALAAYPRDPGEIFERVEGDLPGIAQDMAIFAAIERHTHQPVNGGFDLANRVHFLVDCVRPA